jgi:sortase B
MNKNKDSSLQLLIIAVFTILLYFSAVLMDYCVDTLSNNSIYEEIDNAYHTIDIKRGLTDEELAEYQKEMSELKSINEDIQGWLTIDGTSIDYPVLQGEDNVYYLNYNIVGERSYHAAVMLDFRNDVFSEEYQNIVLYGHNMTDGSMFYDLSQYKNENFYQGHDIIEFNSMKEPGQWTVFSVVVTDDLDVDRKVLFTNEKEYSAYLSDIQNKSLYPIDVEVSSDDEIITLVTCSYETDHSNLLIFAKK